MSIRYDVTTQVRRLIVWHVQVHAWEHLADVLDTELINNTEQLFRDDTVGPNLDESVTPSICDYVEHKI